MAVGTFAPDARHGTNYTLGAALHYGIKIQCGTYTPSTSAGTSVGDIIATGFDKTPEIVLFETPMAKVGGSTVCPLYMWDATNSSVRWIMLSTNLGGASAGLEATTTQIVTGLTAKYLAISF